MGFYALFDDVGRCVTSGQCVDGQEVLQGSGGHRVIETDALINAWEWWLPNGAMKKMPPRPGESYEFDYQHGEWRFDLPRGWELIRTNRDALLASTDWRVIKAQERGESLDKAWVDYRQALRDVTNQGDPQNIIWPQAPEGGD